MKTKNRARLPGIGYILSVNHGMPLAKAVARARLDWPCNEVTVDRFPSSGGDSGMKHIVVEVVLFDHVVSSEEVVEELAHRGLRPATIAEELAFAAAHPKKQRRNPIVALGSIARVGSERCVPCLYEEEGKRGLHLTWWGSAWGIHYRFLAVRLQNRHLDR